MIYLDNAATTLQKPEAVAKAVARAMVQCGNPGRSGHKPAMEAARIVYDCRCAAAELFGIQEPEQVIFTANATHALNIAINSLAECGGHAVISGYEHNSVVRPLERKTACHFAYTMALSAVFDQKDALEKIRMAIRPDTTFVVCNAVSNVFGNRLPIWEVDKLCARKGLALVLDLSQAAGVMPLDCSKLKSRCFCCMPGHKSLYGPQGTGILLCLNGIKPKPFTHGGTGSNSESYSQPDFLPDMLESGTLNVHGIAGLREGIRFVSGLGPARIGAYEHMLCGKTAEGLSVIPGVTVYAGEGQTGVLSFSVSGMDPQEVCEKMGARGVCLRGGLHCAPLAHRSVGTMPHGTVRVSFSAFNRTGEVDRFLSALQRVVKND